MNSLVPETAERSLTLAADYVAFEIVRGYPAAAESAA